MCINIEQDNTNDSHPKDGRLFNAWANMEVRMRRLGSARKILRRGIDMYPKDHAVSLEAKNHACNRKELASMAIMQSFTKNALPC